MGNDRIITDDALISTDVDKLIRVIAERRKLSIFDLQRLSGIRNRNDLETWIRVLEDEGYVKVEYGITGTYISWTGAPYRQKQAEDEQKTSQESGLDEQPQAPEVAEQALENYDDRAKEENDATGYNETSQPTKEEKTPEELLDEYIKMKRNMEYGAKIESAGKNEEENVLDLKKAIVKKLETKEQKKEPDIKAVEEIAEDLEQLKTDRTEDAEPPEPAILQEEEPVVLKTVYDNDVRDIIAAYMEEIKEERERLEQLKRKKEQFYKEELGNLQKMSETELLSFMDAVLMHEKKLLELREEVLQLPEKVEDALKVRNELRALSERAKTTARNTKNKVEELVLSLKLAENDLRSRVSNIKTLIENNEKKISALESIKESIEGRAEKIRVSAEALRGRMDELKGMMETLEQYLNETKQTKDELEAALAGMREMTSQKQAELESIENELEDLNKLSAWVREYVNDYDSKIAEIDQYVGKSEKDIAALKQAAHAAYLKKYLVELQGLSEKYEEKLNEAVKTERGINAEIENSKERIAQLVKESQKIVERIGNETKETNYEQVKKTAEARSKKLRHLVEEKATEKKNLSETIKKRKKSKKR